MSLTKKEIKIISLLVLDTIFFLVEIIIGYTVNSLALIADSFHMLNDIISLVVALWAVNVAKTRSADADYTYGWLRAEILGALINAVFLLALCFTIFVEAIQRLIQPPTISNAQLILIVGTLGLLSNIAGLFLFHEHGHSHGGSTGGEHSHSHYTDEEAQIDSPEHGHDHSHAENHNPVEASENSKLIQSNPMDDDASLERVFPAYVVKQLDNSELHSTHNHSDANKKAPTNQKSMNMQGVYLHVLGDALGNIGVIITALFIWKTDYSWRFYCDPVISLVITCIIFSSALPLCKSSSRILLQGTPQTIDTSHVVDDILKISGVLSVHDVHIWNLTEKLLIASLHVELDTPPDQFLNVASQIKVCLHEYGVHSATIQPEFSAFYQKQHMLPRGFSSSQNLYQDNVNSSTATTNHSSNQGHTLGAVTTSASSNDIYANDSRNVSTKDIHCLVDASAKCTTSDCIN